MTIEEFGKTIKAKHPEYNDLQDADLGEKMLAKYPEYKDMVTPKLTTTQKVANFAGNAAPIVMGGIGALAGSAIGPAGTVGGSAAGVAGGRMIQEELKNLTGQQTKNSLKQVEGVAKDTAINAALTAGTIGAGKVISKAPSFIKSILPEVKLGGKASQIAGANKTPVDATKIIDRAKQILNESKVVGSTKQKALLELDKITPDAPNTVIDALMGRRGVDKQIVRDLFGRPKSGVGKNVGLNAYRQALDEVIKKVPELAKIDKQLSTYYKIKDPVINILTNKTVHAVGGGAAILKLLGIGSKD